MFAASYALCRCCLLQAHCTSSTYQVVTILKRVRTGKKALLSVVFENLRNLLIVGNRRANSPASSYRDAPMAPPGHELYNSGPTFREAGATLHRTYPLVYQVPGISIVPGIYEMAQRMRLGGDLGIGLWYRDVTPTCSKHEI